MNTLHVAAALSFATGLAHSVIGEVLIFQRLRRGTVVPTHGGDALGERHVRILWASWHVLTLLGWCMALMLVELAAWPANDMTGAITRLITVGMLTGGPDRADRNPRQAPRLGCHGAGFRADRSGPMTRRPSP